MPPYDEGDRHLGVDRDDQAVATRATIYVDGERQSLPATDVTGAEILALAGKSPDSHELYARGHHGLRIDPEQAVEVQDGSQFETRPRR